MTDKPKTFKTTITWFDSKFKKPIEEGFYNVLVYCDCECVWIATYSSEDNSFELVSGLSRNVDVKYWAYLPKLPEFE